MSFSYANCCWLLFLVALGTARPSQAQDSRPATAYLVTQAGDTVRGQIQVPHFVSENGVKVSSNTDKSANRTYLPANSKAFVTADGRRYRQRNIVFTDPHSLRPTTAGNKLDSVGVFLQELVLGKARLYRLEYHREANQGPLEYTGSETVFYYAQVPGSSLSLIRSSSFQLILKELFSDCPSAQGELRHTRFDAAGLAKLFYNYNTTCAAGFGPSAMLPLSAPNANGKVVFGIQAGAVFGTMRYPDSRYISNASLGGQVNFTAGISLEVQDASRLSIASGLYFTARHNQQATTQVVPAYYANAGETLNLSNEIRVNTIQVPLVARYALGKTPSGLRPFLAVGLVPGVSFGGQINQIVVTDTYKIGTYTSTQVAAPRTDADRNSGVFPLGGGQASVGVQPTLGKVRGIAELYYEAGQQLTGGSESDSKFTYQGIGVRVGVHF